MDLDLPTLMAVGAFIAAVSAAVILVACPRGRDSRGCFWWVVAGIATALAIALLLFGSVRGDAGLIFAAQLFFALSPAFYWTGARVFGGRRPSYPLMLAGALVVAALGVVPPFRIAQDRLPELGLLITAAYLFAGAAELLRGKEKVLARWPLMALFFVHGALFVAGAAERTMGDPPAMDLVPLTSWFGLVHFESIVFSVGTTAFVIAFVRERGEARQRRVAEVDSVTGVSTRRAFLDHMGDMLERSRGRELPLSLVVFDLDHFKSVNDTHGHAVGDKVLRLFGDTVRGALRRDDRVGRIGGEEFALLLPETSLASAIEIAERVRLMYEAVARAVDGMPVGGTVSVGVASASSDSTAQSLLIAADAGLYEAKARGRNRVECAPAKAGRGGRSALSRVA